VLTQTCTYTLTSATFNKAIRKILSYKNESSFVRLENALTLENKGNRYVHYLKLLGEDESGNQGHYCEMLRAQVCHFKCLSQCNDGNAAVGKLMSYVC
jgi:hypothetical protein